MNQYSDETRRDGLKRTILSLCSVMSVSGFESRSAEAIRTLLAPLFDEYRTDAVGNHLLTRRSGREGAPKILVDAHYDEIGMMVSEICENGFLRLCSVGGISPTILQAADVWVYGKKTLRGVITSTPPHLRGGGSDKEKLPSCEELLVDTGYSKEAIAELVSVGTPVGFAPVYGELKGEKLTGKSFDNQACAAVALYAALSTPKEDLAGDVTVCLSAYEETSRMGGITPAVFSERPSYAMVIDVNLARVPKAPKRETVPMDEGISLAVSSATDLRLTRMSEELCRKKEIPHCMVAAPSSTGTNSTSVQLVGRGVPVVDVGLPLKSMHTYNEVISMEDVVSLARFVEAFISSGEIADAFGETDEVIKGDWQE